METGFGEPCTQLGRGLQELPGWEVYKTTRQRFCFVYRPDNGTPSTSWVVPSSVCSEPTSSSSWCGLVLPSLKILCNSESLWSKMTRVDLRNYLEQIYNVPVAAVRTRVQHGSNRRRDHKSVRIKKPDYKVAYVQLAHGQTFTFPDLFPEKDPSPADPLEEEPQLQRQSSDPRCPGIPSWFGL
ncbi:39S ribosomal protein L23, mitochondrial isoform X2 [Cricetulus griseus]|uniref:Large ribosomal subunit protein uL23m n=1 Tax=Cricetulus griseus TaxID=10029 RepID=A0A9J7FP21_CRIGR|nr:39S ribosomal protein L23, mitochondrial isoform X2 [Cricetulus griseus]XP_027297817.1 39S ribosomal protein L23, mitochondrial isoform X2 [Cricetulus griseus]